MVTSFDQFQKFGQGSLDAAVKSLGAFTANAQAIATETADFAKKSLEQNSTAVEKLFGARTLDKAVEIQADYVKATYESLVGQTARMGVLFSALATDSLKPFEGLVTGKSA